MAHACSRFKYAFEQCDDADAVYILGCMGDLYGLEREYEEGALLPEQIPVCRQSLKTKEIVGRLRSKLDAMLRDEHPLRGELMEKAMRYIDTFWKKLFGYLNDGRNSVDNSIAERFIRPLRVSVRTLCSSVVIGWWKCRLHIIRSYLLVECMVYQCLSSLRSYSAQSCRGG